MVFQLTHKKIFIATFPIVIGTLIYLVSRDSSIRFNNWAINFIEIKPFVFNMPGWIKYNLIDGLFSFSLLSFLFIIWNTQIPKYLLLFTIIALLLSEILQLKIEHLKLIPGTFDFLDLLFIIFGIAMSIIINHKTKKQL